MQFVIEAMTLPEAREVISWRYPPPYDFYDITAGDEDLRAWLADGGTEGRYSAFSEGLLAGFFSFGADTRVSGGGVSGGDYSGDALDVGLALRPDLAGGGHGAGLLEAGLDFARRSFSPTTFRLSVARFNERAITVYERAGFREGESFLACTNGGRYPFVLMERDAPGYAR